MSMTANASLYIGNDNSVELLNWKRADTGAVLNAATVSFQLRDADLVAIGSPVSMANTGDSSGSYRGTIPSTQALTEGAIYYIDITAAESPYDAFWRLERVAAYRSR